MCKYQSKSKPKNCPYPKQFEKKGKILPQDENGLCLFHSNNLAWKKENNFEPIVTELIINLDKEGNAKNYENNFSGFIFINGKYSNLFFNKVFKQRIKFSDCIFHNALRVEKTTLAGIDFSGTVFMQTPVFKNVEFSGMLYALETKFQNGLYVEGCSFKRHVYFDKSLFQNQAEDKRAGVIFKKCTFGDSLVFNSAIFELMTSFSYLSLKDTDFTNAHFLKECYFEEIEVNKTIQFNKTEFFYTEVISSYYSSVDFQKIELKETGKIIFKGKEPFYDQVKGEIYIGFSGEPEGTILIENFNLNKFENNSKLKLFELEKSEVVQIGTGCRKYKNQTRPKRIEINKGNQSLVSELTSTFVEFFMNKNGLNLGVEVVSRGEDYIEIIYFSDEEISKNLFLERLKASEMEMWRLVKVHQQSVHGLAQKETLPEKIIAGTDTIINLVGLILKIGVRMPMGRINKKELNALISSTQFNTTPAIDSSTFETLNIHQTILLGIGNSQNINL